MFKFYTLCFLNPHITPAVPVISVLGQEFKSALILIDWYSFSSLWHVWRWPLHMLRTRGHNWSNRNRTPEVLALSAPLYRGWVEIPQVEKHSSRPPAQTQLPSYFNHNWANSRQRAFVLGWQSGGLSQHGPGEESRARSASQDLSLHLMAGML